MSNLLELKIPYWLLTIIVMAFFYGIYFTKMIVQKKHGIRTHQIGRRKEKGLHTVEMLMSAATLVIVVAQLLSVIFGWNVMPSIGRIIGFFIGMVGDGIFLSAVLCMKDSWRAGIPENDKTGLVTGGIYSFSRNPAFVGFDLMYIGILLMYCNIFTGLFTAFAIITLHLQILQEEKFMEQTFKDEYKSYKQKVFRYLGRR